MQDAYLKGVRRLRWDAERLAAERERRLRELLVYAADHSPFWRERLAGHDLANFTEADLPSLPVLTRAEMMAEFDRVVTVPGLTLARVQQHLDQSDGDRGYLDDEYQAIITSGYIGTQAVHVYGWDAFVTFVMQGSRWTGRRGEDPDAVLAQAFATSTRHESGIFHAFSTFESGGPPSHCSGGTQPLDEIVDGLNNARPAVQALQAWPSLMRELALEAIAGRLTIKPTWVSVAGEVCTPPVREAVRSAWGIETSEFWGCSEGTYAFPCGVGEGMHVADDLVILEPADADGNVVPLWATCGTAAVDQPVQPDAAADPLRPRRRGDDVRRAVSVRVCPSPHHIGQRSDRRSLRVRQRCRGAPGGPRADHPRHRRRRQLLRRQDARRCGRVRGDRRLKRPPAVCGRKLIDVLRRHGGPDSDVVVQEVDSIDRLWSGKSKQFDAR